MPFSGLSVSSSPTVKGDPTNRVSVGKLLGKTLLEKRNISFLYLLVVLIDKK